MSVVALVRAGRLDLSLVVITVVGLGINAVSAGEGGSSIQFSSSDDPSVSTNVSRFSSKEVQDELMKRRFKEDFFKSLESGHGSLDAVMVPSVRSPSLSPAQAKRIKEDNDRKKNWVFEKTDEQTQGPTMEEIFRIREYGPDGMEKQSLSQVERFYLGLGRERSGSTNQTRERFDSDTDEDSLSRELTNPLTGDTTRPDGLLRNLFGAKPNDGPFSGPAFSDSRNPLAPPLEPTRAERERRDDFTKLLDSRSPVSSFAAPLSPLNDLGPGRLNGLDRGLDGPGLGGLSPPLRLPSAPPSHGSTFGQSSLSPAYKPVEPPKAPPPLLTIPKRKF